MFRLTDAINIRDQRHIGNCYEYHYQYVFHIRDGQVEGADDYEEMEYLIAFNEEVARFWDALYTMNDYRNNAEATERALARMIADSEQQVDEVEDDTYDVSDPSLDEVERFLANTAAQQTTTLEDCRRRLDMYTTRMGIYFQKSHELYESACMKLREAESSISSEQWARLNHFFTAEIEIMDEDYTAEIEISDEDYIAELMDEVYTLDYFD